MTPNTIPPASTVYPEEKSMKRGATYFEMNGTISKDPQTP